MQMLPSGLPEHVGDQEDLSRFLTSTSHFNSVGPKAVAFLPNPKYKNTSVFRLGNDPHGLRQIWKQTATGDRSLKGAAICKARDIRASQLQVIAAEPPPAHADIEGWPWIPNDPELQKAQQLELANQIASVAELVRL
jgi:hypothetical protein